MYYPAQFTPDTNGTLLVTFRDVPEAVGVGEKLEIAHQSALDGLQTAFGIYMDERRPIPAPSPVQDGEHAIYLPVSVQAKLALYHEMLSQNVSQAELAKRLGVVPQKVTRLVDLSHTTKIDTLALAFDKLGKRLSIAFS